MKLYGLFDPLTDELRYIGKTTASLSRRLVTHKSEALAKRKTHRHKWVASLLDLGLEPKIELLDTVPGNGCGAEIAMIGIARSLGCKLVNGTAGGDGVTHLSPQARMAIRNGQTGRVHSLERKIKTTITRLRNLEAQFNEQLQITKQQK